MKHKKLWWGLLAAVLVVALLGGIRWAIQRVYRHQHRMDVWWDVNSYAELSKKMKNTPVVLLDKDEYGLEDDVQYGTWMDGPEDDRRPVGYSASGFISMEDETYRLDMDGGPVAVLGAPEGHVLSVYRGTEIHTRRFYQPYVGDGKTQRQVIASIELGGYLYRATFTYDAPGSSADKLQAREDILEQKNVELLQTIIDRYLDRS